MARANVHGSAWPGTPRRFERGCMVALALCVSLSLPRCYYFLSFFAGPFARSPSRRLLIPLTTSRTPAAGLSSCPSFPQRCLLHFALLHKPTTYPLFCIVPSPPKHKQHQSLPPATSYLIRLHCLQTPRRTFNTRAGSCEAIFGPGPITS